MKEMITVEKEVYETVLRNSIKVCDLEAENQQLKELLKECREEFACLNIGGVYWAGDFDEILEKLDNAIGEKNNGD